MTVGALSTGVLVVHILAGVIALVSGFGAIVTAKDRQRHNQAGRVYVLSMGTVVTTAVPLAVWVENWFLLAIAVFSGYLVFGGYRIISRRRVGLETSTWVDWLGNGTMIAVGTAMVAVGGWGSVTDAVDLGPVLVVFGLIGGLAAGRELRQFTLPRAKRAGWFERHIVFMGGAFIATVTATITVNLTMVPPLARWLGPTVIGVPLIFYAIRTYRPVFGRPRGQQT